MWAIGLIEFGSTLKSVHVELYMPWARRWASATTWGLHVYAVQSGYTHGTLSRKG